MKKSLLFIAFLILKVMAFAQPASDLKRDYAWLTGYVSTDDPINFPDYKVGYRFDFSVVPVDTFYAHNRLDIWYTDASISDENGQLLFYTNGCRLADAQDSIVSNSEINEGSFGYLTFCADGNNGFSVPQGVAILPMPGDSDLFCLLHLSRTYAAPPWGNAKDSLRYSLFRRDAPTSKLETVFTDSILLDGDSLYVGQLAACRHANGRDWWLLQPKSGRAEYYRVLLGPDGPKVVGEQEIGVPNTWWENGGGQAQFSPDGSRYARYAQQSGLQLFDFDRCTGELSNARLVGIHEQPYYGYAAGMAFSPNSRFLYVTTYDTVYQFDAWADDLAASRQVVCVYDGSYTDPGYLFTFNYMQLGPDGKVYFNCPGGKEAVHVIESPDSLGPACNVAQHKYVFDLPISPGWPYFPNFRLGALQGSPCDTVPPPTSAATQRHRAGNLLRTYPNPATDHVTADVTLPEYGGGQVAELLLVGPQGQVVASHRMAPYSPLHSFGLRALPPGVYLVVLKVDGQVAASERVFKVN